MTLEEFQDTLEELVSAEDFLDYFAIPYDPAVVQVNRLHILQRFHNYLSAAQMPQEYEGIKAVYVNALTQAYDSFVNSDAQTEKVLKIFQKSSGLSYVPIDSLGKGA